MAWRKLIFKTFLVADTVARVSENSHKNLKMAEFPVNMQLTQSLYMPTVSHGEVKTNLDNLSVCMIPMGTMEEELKIRHEKIVLGR